MLKIISNSLRFGSHAGKQHGPRTSGLLWFGCWLFTGDLCGCVAVLAVGCVLYTAALM